MKIYQNLHYIHQKSHAKIQNRLKLLIMIKKYYKNISLQGSNLFSISHLGNVNNQKKLLVSQLNNTIIDVNILDLKDTYKDTIYKKITK